MIFLVKNKGQTQKASGPKFADCQYVGVEKFTRRLVWNRERAGRFSSNFEDRFWGHASYSNIDSISDSAMMCLKPAYFANGG